MVNRIISVGDDFTLPASVKTADANLPAASKAAAIALKLDKTEAGTTYAAKSVETTKQDAFPDSQAITYNGDGTVATVTENGILTIYTYNGDGTVATDVRAGVTRTYTYTDGNLTGIEAA